MNLMIQSVEAWDTSSIFMLPAEVIFDLCNYDMEFEVEDAILTAVPVGCSSLSCWGDTFAHL